MQTYNNLALSYTSDEADNSTIWPCSSSWTNEQIQDRFSEFDDESKKAIFNYLTSEPHIAEGLNLIVE